MSYFNFSGLPFTKEIPDDRLLSLPTVERALASVRLLVHTRGIGLLTAESGTGKSCVIRLLAAELNPGLHKLVYFCHSSIGILEFYSHLCAGFGLQPRNQRAPMFRDLKDRILSLNRSSHIHPILVLDESHLLCTEILQELRLLTNFEIDSYNALTVLLCGQEALTKKFALSQLAPLANSITVATSLATLAKEESFSYLEQRLAQVGGHAGRVHPKRVVPHPPGLRRHYAHYQRHRSGGADARLPGQIPSSGGRTCSTRPRTIVPGWSPSPWRSRARSPSQSETTL